MVIGSPEYTAPERLRGAEGLPASDLFSLGATLYQAVEGISPFRRDTPPASLTAVLLDQPPPPRRAGPLAHLVTRLLDKDPGTRPTVRDALAMTGVATGPSTTSIQAPTGVIRQPTRVFGARGDAGWRPVAEVLVALVVLFCILGFPFLSRGFVFVWDGLADGVWIGVVIDVVLASALCAGIARLVPPRAGPTAARAVGVAGVIIGGLVAYFCVMTIVLSALAFGYGPVVSLSLITAGLVAAFVWHVVALRRACPGPGQSRDRPVLCPQ